MRTRKTSNPAPGWYPSPRAPGVMAWWDGEKWHLEAKKLIASWEIVSWIVGIAAGLIVSAIFPPTLVMVAIVAGFWYFSDQNKKQRARVQWEWDQQHGQPPR